MTDIMIRRAEARDIAPTLEIYNFEVEHGTATLDLHKKTEDEWRAMFARHNADNHPLLVAEIDGETVGYASLSPYREKEAYASTVEASVYVARAFRRRGVGTALLSALIETARADGITHAIVSVITSENADSERLHERFGFRRCGTLFAVGEKFGRYLDIDNYELII